MKFNEFIIKVDDDNDDGGVDDDNDNDLAVDIGVFDDMGREFVGVDGNINDDEVMVDNCCLLLWL